MSRTIAEGNGGAGRRRPPRSRRSEVVSNAAVMMFGGIETSEGMTTTPFWHLLTNPEQLAALRNDRSLGGAAVDESLRLEPAARRVDRYCDRRCRTGRRLDPPEGDLVIVSLSRRQPRPGDVFRSGSSSIFRGPTPDRTSPSPRVPTLAWASTWPGWKPRQPSSGSRLLARCRHRRLTPTCTVRCDLPKTSGASGECGTPRPAT